MSGAVGSAGDGVAPFTAAYRVRFDESSPEGLVTASALLRYAQDCAWQHSEVLGFDRAWYAGRAMTWVVRAAQVEVLGPVGTGAWIDVTTAIVGFRRIWARRRTSIAARGAEVGGDRLATVETDWVMTHAETGAPTRVPDEFLRLFDTPVASFQPHRVALEPTPALATRQAFRVRRSELDPLEHVNNAAYLDWLEDAAAGLPAGHRQLGAIPRTYVLEYVAAADATADLVGAVWLEPDETDGTDELPTVAYRVTSGPTEVFRGTIRAR
jgi:acyl-ACP thioesterase